MSDEKEVFSVNYDHPIFFKASPTELAIGQQIMDYAGEHYEDGGWDVIYECHTAESVAAMIWSFGGAEDITNFEEALEDLKGVVSVWADREADAQNSAF
jgi:hypothetical protein